MTASIPLDEVFHFDVITSNPTTGAASDADSTPTFAVYEESTDTDIGVGGNMTKRTSLTGNYRASFTMSAANGFEVGKFYSVIASATVSTIAGKTVAAHIRCVAAEAIAGKPKADVDAWLGTAAATPTVAGVPSVEVVDVSTAGKSDIAAAVLDEDVTAHQTAGTLAWSIGDPAAVIGTSLTVHLANNLDAAVSTRLATASYTAPPTAAANAAAVWDEDATAHQTQGTFGQAIGDPVADTNTIYKAVVTDATGATVGVDVVAVKAETASIQADTDNIQTRLPAALVSGRMDSSVGAMATDVLTSTALAASAVTEITDATKTVLGIVTGTADSGTTTTMVDAARTEADTDYWKGAWIVFTSGTISGQARRVTAFTPASDTITFDPATTQAVSTQNYILIPGRSSWDEDATPHQTTDTFGYALGDPEGIADSTLIEFTRVRLDSNITSRLAASAYVAPLDAAGTRSAVGLASANLDTQLDALPTAAENATALLASAVEGAITVLQSLRLANAALGGKASGLDTTTAVFRDLADSKDRITATVDANGNRSAVTRDLT